MVERSVESILSVEESVVIFTSKANGNSVECTAGQSVKATVDGLSNVQEDGFSMTNLDVMASVVIGVVLIASIIILMFRKRKK